MVTRRKASRVEKHPESAGREGNKRLRWRISDLNAEFPRPYLDLLNARHMLADDSHAIFEGMMFAEIRPRTPNPTPAKPSLLRGEVPSRFTLSAEAATETRRLLGRLNRLPDVSFCVVPEEVPYTTHLLPIHYVGALLRHATDALIRERGSSARAVFRYGAANLLKVEQWALGRLGDCDTAKRLTDLGDLIRNCREAVTLLAAFDRLGPALLGRLRHCANPRCPAPYFLGKMGPKAAHCSPACYSLARSPHPKQPRTAAAAFVSE